MLANAAAVMVLQYIRVSNKHTLNLLNVRANYIFKKLFVFNFGAALGLRCGPRAPLVVAHSLSCLTAGGILNFPN